MDSTSNHRLTAATIATWPAFTQQAPLRLIVSACLGGDACGVDGSTNGTHPLSRALLSLPNVCVVKFCPEHAAVGTPPAIPDIVGGDGFDVLDGRASFASDAGDDWTVSIVDAAEEMARRATGAHLALLMDMSGACGSSVIYAGPRSLRMYRRGPGVAAARLMRLGLPVVSQRDERTLLRLFDESL